MKRRVMLCGSPVEYELERKRIKNINLRVKADGIHVSASRLVPASAVDAFLVDNARQILRMRERQASRETLSPEARDFSDGSTVPLLGRKVPVRVLPGTKNSAAYADGVFALSVKDPEDGELRCRTGEKYLRELCRELVTERCRHYYPAFAARGIGWPELRFRRMRSRWGSCQPREGVLCFNTALVSLPVEELDYVVVHEFCHFLHPDHSAAFYAEVERLLPDWRARRSAMKGYQL